LNSRKRMVIAIDGPSGAGKSTIARLLAHRLGYTYIDTGALYRAVGWKVTKEQLDPGNESALAELCERVDVALRYDDGVQRVSVDGTDVTEQIRTPEMGMKASAVSKSSAVRARLLSIQRAMGEQGGVVMDGRDIGTVVFPNADVKFFLDASADERGRRRWKELRDKGLDVDLAAITGEIKARDDQDSKRDIAPLRKADDAFYVDSSAMTIDEVVNRLMGKVAEKS